MAEGCNLHLNRTSLILVNLRYSQIISTLPSNWLRISGSQSQQPTPTPPTHPTTHPTTPSNPASATQQRHRRVVAPDHLLGGIRQQPLLEDAGLVGRRLRRLRTAGAVPRSGGAGAGRSSGGRHRGEPQRGVGGSLGGPGDVDRSMVTQ